MKKIVVFIFLLLLTAVILGNLSGESEMNQEALKTDRDYYTPETLLYLNNLALPTSRKFYMGFTSSAYDFNEQAYQDTYTKVAQHSDLLAFHLDWGVQSLSKSRVKTISLLKPKSIARA